MPRATQEGANHITALMLDAQSPRGPQDCFSPYHPSLMLETSPAECLQAGCNIEARHCRCSLNRQEVSIGPDVEPPMQVLRREPPSILPTQAMAGDFSYIFNLSRPPLKQVIDPEYLGSSPPQILAARMTVPFESITACGLSHSKEAPARTLPMDFRKLDLPAREDDVRQAVAEEAVVSFRPAYPVVTVTISGFDGGNPRHLTVRRGSIMLLNVRDPLLEDDPCANGVSRDFSLFYELSLNPLPWRDRPIPHLRQDLGNGKNLEASECSKFNTFWRYSYPVTPLVAFNP